MIMEFFKWFGAIIMLLGVPMIGLIVGTVLAGPVGGIVGFIITGAAMAAFTMSVVMADE